MMPFTLDKVDVRIIMALNEDGRKSFRQLAKITGVSTPTVEVRIRRMFETGLIKRISPIFDIDKVANGLSAIVTLRVDDNSIQEIASNLAEFDAVRSIFLTTGESNIMLRLITNDAKELQDFISNKTRELGEIKVISSQIITQVPKDEQGVLLEKILSIPLECDFCKGEIAGKPINLRVGNGERFFCCKICLKSYKEKYDNRIKSISTSI